MTTSLKTPEQFRAELDALADEKVIGRPRPARGRVTAPQTPAKAADRAQIAEFLANGGSVKTEKPMKARGFTKSVMRAANTRMVVIKTPGVRN